MDVAKVFLYREIPISRGNIDIKSEESSVKPRVRGKL